MTTKINSKNLSYDNSAPPFLAALRAQAAGARGPDPILAAQRRSAKKRSSSEEAEDAPLVVDEDGNVVSLEVDKDGVVKDKGDQDPEPAEVKEATKESENKAAIGGRKRKVGKVVGDAADETKTEGDDKKKDVSEKESAKNRKPKKKAKKIKLSFDEDEG
ncbi:Ff.00g074510.m01.CDS01 [Fusarium sp. VM40]|nr:Ff.00g074510.m01.CDS01 [Fusarium sp. VM40]